MAERERDGERAAAAAAAKAAAAAAIPGKEKMNRRSSSNSEQVFGLCLQGEAPNAPRLGFSTWSL